MNHLFKTSTILLLTLVVSAALIGGCKSKKPVDVDFDPNAGGGPESTTGDGQPDIDLSSLLFGPNGKLKTVYFDYDSSSLRPDALTTLSNNAQVIKETPGVVVQVEGHCDERGTQEYNLALGERRALAVRNHLIQLGVSGDRLVTLSYGEEFPAAMGGNEAAWAQNRRCAFSQAQR